VLLAVLAISAAIGLIFGRHGRRDAPRASAVPAEPKVVASASDLKLKLNPNEATPEDLAALPSIGATLARRIAEARADGPFLSADDIRARVRGIGPVTLARIKPYLEFGVPQDVGPRLDSAATAIVDVGAGSGVPSGLSRKPPRSKSRTGKNSGVQLVAKSGAAASPSP
jgi:Helix-hairpin-helix motif